MQARHVVQAHSVASWMRSAQQLTVPVAVLDVTADPFLIEQGVAQVHDQELRRERLAGRVRRAHRLAAPALGAGVEVELLLPPELLHVLEANRRLGEIRSSATPPLARGL